MKISHTTEPASFKPVTVHITFDTANELRLFRTLVSSNISVPACLVSSYLLNSTEQKPLTEIMSKITYGLP